MPGMLGNSLVQLLIACLFSAWLTLADIHSQFWGWACAIALAVLFVVAFLRLWQLPGRSRFSLSNLRLLRWNGRISLREAAHIIYTEARATDSVWAYAAERRTGGTSPDDILNFICKVMARDTPFFGKRPPSTHLERLEPMQLKNGTVIAGGRELQMRDETRALFTDLEVETKQLRRALDKVRDGLKTTTLI